MFHLKRTGHLTNDWPYINVLDTNDQIRCKNFTQRHIQDYKAQVLTLNVAYWTTCIPWKKCQFPTNPLTKSDQIKPFPSSPYKEGVWEGQRHITQSIDSLHRIIEKCAHRILRLEGAPCSPPHKTKAKGQSSEIVLTLPGTRTLRDNQYLTSKKDHTYEGSL